MITQEATGTMSGGVKEDWCSKLFYIIFLESRLDTLNIYQVVLWSLKLVYPLSFIQEEVALKYSEVENQDFQLYKLQHYDIFLNLLYAVDILLDT